MNAVCKMSKEPTTWPCSCRHCPLFFDCLLEYETEMGKGVIVRRGECPMRHENGNCTVSGGFCSAVNDSICEALHNAYDCGKRAGYVVERSRWISVEDRLPEEDGWYITMTNAMGKTRGVIPMRYTTSTVRGQRLRRWTYHDRLSPWRVTHWMPLPEPLKEDA